MDLDDKKLAEFLRLLKPGERVRYKGWRGDSGEGIFVRLLHASGAVPSNPRFWGNDTRDALIIKRDFSADEGRKFMPFARDGDVITTDLMAIEYVMES